jgi:hypothetical protein
MWGILENRMPTPTGVSNPLQVFMFDKSVLQINTLENISKVFTNP